MKNALKLFFSTFLLFLITFLIILITYIYLNQFVTEIVGLVWLSSYAFFVALSLRILISKRRKEVKVTWILAVLSIPFFGFFAYIYYGRLKFYKKFKVNHFKNINKKEYMEKYIDSINEVKNLENNNNNFYEVFKNNLLKNEKVVYTNNDFEIINSPAQSYIEIFNEIEKAKNYIFVNYYIIGKKQLFDYISKILIKKAKEGVRVYLIYDHVGSFFLAVIEN